jgi:hypothetical protein
VLLGACICLRACGGAKGGRKVGEKGGRRGTSMGGGVGANSAAATSGLAPYVNVCVCVRARVDECVCVSDDHVHLFVSICP